MKMLLKVAIVLLAFVAIAMPSNAQVVASGGPVSIPLGLTVGESLTISSPQNGVEDDFVWSATDNVWETTGTPVTVNVSWNLNNRHSVMLYAWLSSTTPFNALNLGGSHNVMYNSSVGDHNCGASTLQDNSGGNISIGGLGLAGADCGQGDKISSGTSVTGPGSTSVTITLALQGLAQNIPAGTYTGDTLFISSAAF